MRVLNRHETRDYLDRVFRECENSQDFEDENNYVVSSVFQGILRDEMNYHVFDGEDRSDLHMDEIALDMFGSEDVIPAEFVRERLKRVFNYFFQYYAEEVTIQNARVICHYALTEKY